MPPKIPTADGEVNLYNLTNSGLFSPVVYFVNGIRVLPLEHATTAAYLSLLIERPVWGVHNKTAGQKLGSVMDGLQSVGDYAQNAIARTSSSRNRNTQRTISDDEVQRFLSKVEKDYWVWNPATMGLFKELVINRNKPQMIIAHSQGNLITSNALFVLEDLLGSHALRQIRVYSLASPSPAWPLGLRTTNGGGGRQDNAFMNDMVALLRPHNLAKKVGIDRFQNAGDFRTHEPSPAISVAPHDTSLIIATLNFLKSIRGDLGLPKDFSPEFLTRSAKIVEDTFRQLPAHN
jgi:hypothetical protein